MPRLPEGFIPQVYRPNSRLADLLLEQGNQQAQATGALWGGIGQSIAGLGQEAGNILQQKSEHEAKLKQQQFEQQRDAKFQSLLQDPNNPPTLAQVVGIYGPERGAALYKGFEALKSPKPDAKTVLAGFKAASPEMRAQAWPIARAHLVQAGAQDEVLPPAQGWGPQHEEWLTRFDQAMSGAKPEKIGTREVKVRNPDGSETVQIVQDTPGQTFQSAAPPKTPEKPKLYEVTVPGPNGPVKKLVGEAEMRAGVDEYKAPPAAKPPTGQERTGLGFYNRAKEALENIAPLEENIAGLNLAGQGRLKYAPNFLQSDEGQKYNQAQKQFTEARLRKESGAQIAASEYENDRKTYFAEPGDSKQTLEQKRRARETVLKGLQIGSGRAYEEFYGEPPDTPANAAPKKNPFR